MVNEQGTTLEADGIVETKQEAMTKKVPAKAYWKFTISGKTYNLFEHALGIPVSVGQSVHFVYTEIQGSYNGAPTTYHNLKSIYPSGEQPVQTNAEINDQVIDPAPTQQQPVVNNNTTVADFKTKDADKYELGMAKNNAAVIFQGLVSKAADVEDAKNIIKQESDFYDKLVEALYMKGKAIREKLLGY